ncbi:hypothetical protein [Chitinophaga cymbidii]|uniref:Lipoprotein n=1 Tax=Chitinophaga cymbidii TaxID=1096750 RepID=A0A512RDQ1_9BACT|nr:hypothetical protein [Chitinophaga cymbidii]GEP93835.1 hypothetical protein CCY01nite_00950 [Chitinophaga cymbidii]
MCATKSVIKASLYLSLFIVSSCARYVDTVRSYSNGYAKNDFFQFYPDSNVFRYKSNVVLTKDTERIYPKFFEVRLPKKIRFYEFIGSTDFSFYYDKGQTVFIKVNLEKSKISRDTVYNPTRDQLGELIESTAQTGNGKYNLNAIPFNEHRKHLVMQRGNATTLLYNIEDKNFDLFYGYISKFRFINIHGVD